MAYLVINSQIYSLEEQEYSIGRHRSSSVKISDVRASKFNAALTQTEDGYLLADLGSLNGTFVNGKRIESQLLVGNEEIRISNTVCYFRSGVPEHMTTAFGTISGAKYEAT